MQVHRLLVTLALLLLQVAFAKSQLEMILEQTKRDEQGVFRLTEKTFDSFIGYSEDLVLVCFHSVD